MKTAKTWRAVVTRDESGAWIVDVPGIRGCHTYGRTIATTRENTRDVIATWLEVSADAVDVALEFDVGELDKVVTEALAARRRAEAARGEAVERTRSAVAGLAEAGVDARRAPLAGRPRRPPGRPRRLRLRGDAGAHTGGGVVFLPPAGRGPAHELGPRSGPVALGGRRHRRRRRGDARDRVERRAHPRRGLDGGERGARARGGTSSTSIPGRWATR